jgi:hypothetical protein
MSFDGDAKETRRNRTIAIGVSVAAVVVVALLFWLFKSLSGPALAVAPAATSTTSSTPAASGQPTPSETTTAVPPTIGTWTPTTTFSLPPPEQPTETAAAQTAPQPAPTTQAAPPPPPPPGPSVSNVNLQCSKGDGRRVTGKLTFKTTTKVDVILSAGGQTDRKSAGPGDVSMTTSGRGPEICFARVGDQTVGPIPAG